MLRRKSTRKKGVIQKNVQDIRKAVKKNIIRKNLKNQQELIKNQTWNTKKTDVTNLLNIIKQDLEYSTLETLTELENVLIDFWFKE